MYYISTRDTKIKLTGAKAIIEGLSKDGGLFVPSEFPVVTERELKRMQTLNYSELSAEILNKFLPEFTIDELAVIAEKSAEKFEYGITAPLVKTSENRYFLELWHGPTHAFKDAALTVLPRLMKLSAAKTGLEENIFILAATSGDTGKAALEGFCDVDGIKIMVIYPHDGVSDVQRLQMTTQSGKNVNVVGVEGNFDDAQAAVKEIFTSVEINNQIRQSGYCLSSANSINLGRLLPQIVYYFSAYFELAESGEIEFGDAINFTVPSGNFGNILAAYYARRMGLPIRKLIAASNKNNVLADFFNSGKYDIRRDFFKTASPSMDILVSSNLERLLFEITGRNADRTKELMSALTKNKAYTLSDNEFAEIKDVFYGAYACDAETLEVISEMHEEYGYIADPHTAVAERCYQKYVEDTGDKIKTVIVSTASPYKFVGDVLEALDITPGKTTKQSMNKLYEETALEIPESLAELFDKKEIYSKICAKNGIAEEALRFIKSSENA